jgi:hypothetical protein
MIQGTFLPITTVLQLKLTQSESTRIAIMIPSSTDICALHRTFAPWAAAWC